MPEASLTNRTILITGASGGLGAAVARAAAAAGAELILTGRRQQPLNAVYDAIVADGGHEPAMFPVDFTKAAADTYDALAEGIKADFGKLDGIVHLAGHFEALTPLANLSIEEWQRSLHVNLTAPFAVTRACLPLLETAPDASVVFTADRIGRASQAFWGGYAAAKGGLETLLGLFAREHAHRDNLRFNAVDPGPTATGLRARAFPADDPQARPPNAAIHLFLHLLGPGSHGVNGQTLALDNNAEKTD